MVELAARGWSQRAIGRELGRHNSVVGAVLRPFGGVHRSDVSWEPSPARLSLEDRVEIKLGLERSESFTVIAARIGRAVSTVSREVHRNNGRDGYQPLVAHRRAQARTRRPKATKLGVNPILCRRVIEDLEALYSPEQIAGRLREEHPDETTMWVSHETIYKSIYVQGRGELRRELARCLRSGRAQRRPQGRMEQRGQIPNMVRISERPAEVADRAVPGHWEGDLILGKNGKTAVGTLVERSTRYVLLLHLPGGRRDAATVDEAMRHAIQKLPAQMFRTITWDQGKELVRHAAFTVDTGIHVYFCDPHSPWQRGSNENTNGLLRQYLPKGTDLSVHTEADLDRIAASLNNRPRKTLGFMKPSEKLTEILATTG
jgi:IS30 family transposase